MSLDAKVTYTFLLNRFQLSRKNGWVNDRGEVFVIFPRKALAKELGPSNIQVNCVAPGVIDTDMNAMHDAETLAGLAEETALGRLGTAEEAARAIRFLCSPDASFVTGQVLGVTGGFVI